MNKKFLYIGLIILMLLSVVILSGCSKKQESIIDEISLYTGSTSVNEDYNLKDGTLSVDVFRGGEQKSKKKKLNEEQIKHIEEIILKYELQTEEIPREDGDREGASITYFTIKLKNDSNIYKSVKDGSLSYELVKYFEDILDI